MFSPTIAVINHSTVLTDEQIKQCLPAFQKQVRQDFAPIYGRSANLRKSVGAVRSGDWWIVVADDSDQAGALGYHETTDEGLPISFVFAKTDLQYHLSWTVTFTHELLEMLADPLIQICAQDPASGLIYAYECCDAVEADELAYNIDGVPVTDFMTPYWFMPPFGKGIHAYDFLSKCDAPFKLLAGGYISIYENGQWTQRYAQGDQARAPRRQISVPLPLSRRERRTRIGLWAPSRVGR